MCLLYPLLLALSKVWKPVEITDYFGCSLYYGICCSSSRGETECTSSLEALEFAVIAGFSRDRFMTAPCFWALFVPCRGDWFVLVRKLF